MILAPFSTPENFKNECIQLGSASCAFWFVFSDQKLLVSSTWSLPKQNPFENADFLYMGDLEGHSCFVTYSETPQPYDGFSWHCLRSLHGGLQEELLSLAGRALQLLHWDRTHRFCGRCGAPTFRRTHERCRECSDCHLLAYPKIAPAILALIKKNDQILLAKHPQAPGAFYSPLAGFVEPGETLEQCLEREIFEEVGLKVSRIRYIASQSWPFSSALMVGFFCDWQEGALQVDNREIEHAQWFDLSSLPLLPPPLSLSRLLIEKMIRSH